VTAAVIECYRVCVCSSYRVI